MIITIKYRYSLMPDTRGAEQGMTINNKYECTMDQELPDAAAYATDRRSTRTHQMATLFCVKWGNGRHLESVTSNRKSDSLIDAYTWKNPAKFHTNPIWNDGVLVFLKVVAPTRTRTRKPRCVAICDQFSSWSKKLTSRAMITLENSQVELRSAGNRHLMK